MINKWFYNFLLSICVCLSSIAQDKDVDINTTKPKKTTDTLTVITTIPTKHTIDPLAPSKAAFYSAILPGLGQAYNKKYWKIPIVYAALGTGVYFYITNNNEYNRYRDAYKSRLAGFTTDEFYGTVTNDGLLQAQETLKRNKELSLLITVGIYILNIVDANVDAHLMQYNIDDSLSVKPHYKLNEIDNKGNFGLTFNFNF